MSLFDSSESFLRDHRRASLARTVTYTRGDDSASILAAQGATDVDLDSGHSVVRSIVVDWIVERADLVLASTTVLPKPGDKISLTVGGDSLTYEVSELGDACYRSHGRDNLSLRIHSKMVSA